MRGVRRALLSVASLCVATSAALADDPYAEYRIPEHYWRSWSASFLGSGSHSVSNATFSSNSTEGNSNGDASTQIAGGYDSDPRSSAYSLFLVATGTRNHLAENHEDVFTSLDHTDRVRTAKEQLRASLSFSRYPWSAPVGLTLGTSGILTLSQGWHSTSRIDANTTAESRTTTNATQSGSTGLLSLSAGLSLGRVRDAT